QPLPAALVALTNNLRLVDTYVGVEQDTRPHRLTVQRFHDAVDADARAVFPHHVRNHIRCRAFPSLAVEVVELDVYADVDRELGAAGPLQGITVKGRAVSVTIVVGHFTPSVSSGLVRLTTLGPEA